MHACMQVGEWMRLQCVGLTEGSILLRPFTSHTLPTPETCTPFPTQPLPFTHLQV